MEAPQRLSTADKALQTLEAIPLPPRSDIERDAAIQRFEYTFEVVWKAAAVVLREVYGIKQASPKPIIRACRENGLLSAEEATLALQMTDHRNLTSHTYNPEVAELIAAYLPLYRGLLRTWLSRLQKAAESA
ncbi:MAG: nucleotidyltransferase substrate binding protein [Bacteroidia bacterium]|nr:nucleotidyltransferase substrate binding protein [Bacteroidia bacterium]